jgi:hypothetical protein
MNANDRIERADALLAAWSSALESWRVSPSAESAIHAFVRATGYAHADVERQLDDVVHRCSSDVMREVRRREVSLADIACESAPRTVLVLASGGIPGLVLEGVTAAFTIDADAIIRPSRDEHVLGSVVAHVRSVAPHLAQRMNVLTASAEVPWREAEAAVVFGSDETIAFVRDQLRHDAAQRVAAYGSRQGIAIVTPAGIKAQPDWATRVADDVLTFRQRGCMCPTWLFVLTDDESVAAHITEEAGRALAHGRARHISTDVDDRIAQRRAHDADVLNAIAEGLTPDASTIYAGDARVTHARVASTSALATRLFGLGSMLQSAVLVCSDEEQRELKDALIASGCSRVVPAGSAHSVDPLWPHDGIGRVAPLLGRTSTM